MNEYLKKLRSIFSEKQIKDRKPLYITALGLFGILCLLLSSGGGREKPVRAAAPENTQASVEKQLEALLETVEGVGKTKVCVTVESLEKNVYAVNTEQTNTGEKTQRTEKYVFSGSGSDAEGVLLYTVMPEIRGVAVSCEGGGSSVVRREVTGLVSAALGITTNKIWVSAMETR